MIKEILDWLFPKPVPQPVKVKVRKDKDRPFPGKKTLVK
jgi:hypothetical protein